MAGKSQNLGMFLNGVRLKKEDPGSRATHFSMSGGKYDIPTEKLNNMFLKRFAHSLHMDRAQNIFLIEKKTPVFRMHMDLDFIQRAAVPSSDVYRFTALLSTIISSFYPADIRGSTCFLAVVLGAPTKFAKAPDGGGGEEEEEEETRCVKSGFHVVWPWLYVNKVQALSMRHACLVDVQQRMPQREWPANPYSDVIDETVLQENGLRMIGCDKSKACPDCCRGAKAKKRTSLPPCDVCNSTRWVGENRRYWPLSVIDVDGKPDEERTARMLGTTSEEFQYKVKFCSLRFYGDETPGYSAPALAPACPAAEKLLRRARKTLNKKGGANANCGNANTFRGDAAPRDMVDVDADTEVFGQMQEFLNVSMGGVHAHVRLTRMMRTANGTRYLCKVDGPGSSYCRNVNRDHGSSTVYFQVEEGEGVFQRCYCKKNNETPQSFSCRLYRGPASPLTPALHGAMFTLAKSAQEKCKTAQNTFDWAKPEERKLALVDMALERIGEHIENSRHHVQTASIAAAASSEFLAQEARRSAIAGGRTAAREPPAKRPPGVNLTWRELDQLSMRDLLKIDAKRAVEAKASAERMHNEMPCKGKNGKQGGRGGGRGRGGRGGGRAPANKRQKVMY